MSTLPFVSASQAGALISNYRFKIPSFQREYSWSRDKVNDFWEDLVSGVESENYFLGLVILTAQDGVMNVVDGQQRLVTLVLLAKAIKNKAKKINRNALADLIESTFLRFIDYSSDDKSSRISFADSDDNNTFQSILGNEEESAIDASDLKEDSPSRLMIEAFDHLVKMLNEYLQDDETAFKLIGKLAEFIMERLHFAVFVHSDESSAYRIFEVINIRGLDLTTADLLKNYVLREASKGDEERQYNEWQRISKEFSSRSSGGNFVQYIKHVVSVECGHIPGKDLYDFISGERLAKKSPPSTTKLLSLLAKNLEIYRQIENIHTPGPISGNALRLFDAFNALDVVTVRPILLALCEIGDSSYRVEGMEHILRLVVRRMVAGSIGAGKVEREFGDVAKTISDTGDWKCLNQNLTDFDISRDYFVERLATRTFKNRRTLTFIRQSIIQEKITPENVGKLFWIWPKGSSWSNLAEENSYWEFTLGNSFLADPSSLPSRVPRNWNDFKENFLDAATEREVVDDLRDYKTWDVTTIGKVGTELAEAAARLWYPS